MYDYDLLVVGSANADLVIGVERRPRAGETVLGSDLAVHPGGKGANQAVAAARLGSRTALLARVGDDGHGRLLLDSLRAAGVDTVGVLVGGAPTGVALITVDPSGDNSIVVSPGANGRLTPGDVRAAVSLFHASRVVSTQLEIPLETVVEVVRNLSPDSRFVLNPSPPRPLPTEILAACDPLIVNEHEAKVILGDACVSDVPEDWARLLLAKGPRSVVVTLGAEGSLVASSGRGEPGGVGEGGRRGHDGRGGRLHGGTGVPAGGRGLLGGGGLVRLPGRGGRGDPPGRAGLLPDGAGGRGPVKKAGILNRHLSGALAELGHGDGVLVCDAGMPIPHGPRVVDLAFRAGVPSFAEVLDGLLAELVVEGGTAAREVRDANPAAAELLDARFPGLELVSHEKLKELSAGARLIVRTGEARPYANVLLRCGVFF
ncbi:ribokinase [Streptomyces pseudovenezuelae]